MENSSLPAVDNQYGSAELLTFFQAYFAAKSARQLPETMRFFAPDMLTYTDATLGQQLNGFAAQRQFFSEYMAKWPATARSYPTRLYGHGRRVVVEFVDSPELFGSEVRPLGIVDLDAAGKIVRWVDYWNGRTFPGALYQQLRTPPAPAPTPIQPLGGAGTGPGLHDAFQRGDVAAITAALATDAVWEDQVLNLAVRGRAEISRLLTAMLARLPYGQGSRWTTALPAAGQSGGAEWVASAAWPAVQGVLAIGCNPQGEIARLAVGYDGRLCPDSALQVLLAAATAPNETPPT